MMRPVHLLAAAACALLAASGPALAHGGQYRGPGGRSPSDPRPAPGTGRGTSTTGWEQWWSANAARYLNLKKRLRARDEARGEVSTGGLGVTAGSVPANRVGGAPVDSRLVYEAEVLPIVMAALEDSDSEVRSAATVALGKMGFARALPALRQARKDKHRDVRDGAVLAMGMLKEPLVVEELRGLLLDPGEDQRTRGFAALGLGFTGGGEACESLLAFLDPKADATHEGGIHRTDQVEASAIVGLGEAGFKPAVETLRKYYASGTRFPDSVRSFLAIALARLGDRDAIPFLLQGLEHDADPMRQSAAIALGVVGRNTDDALLAALSKAALGDRDVNTRQFAIMALARIGGDPAKKVLRTLLDKGQRLDLPFAAIALALLADRDSAPALRKGFAEEKEPSLKGGFAIALGLLGDRESAPGIRATALDRGDAGLRAHCFTAIGLMEDKSSAEPVRKFLEEEKDPGLRLSAALCLGLLQDRATVSILAQIAKEGSNAYARGNACLLLGAVGDKTSARILIDFVRDLKEHSIVRTYAVAALGNLADRSDIPLLSQVGMDSNYALAVDPLVEVATIL